jgi:hypothetical protein
MTSTTITRWWLSAVLCSRSRHSVAKATAVSKPKVVKVLSRSLSMVLGTPTTRSPSGQRVGDGERAVAADGHQGVEFLHREVLQDLVRAVHVLDAAVRHLHREVQRIALVRGAQDGAAQVGDAAHPVAGEAEHAAVGVALGEQDAVEAVANAVALPAAVDRGHDDGADDGVEARGVAPAGAHGDASNGAGHGGTPL